MKSLVTLWCVMCLYAVPLFSQSNCPFPGQSPHSAIPICGVSVFSQQNAALACGDVFKYMATCPMSLYRDYNSFWYKFTCYQPGTLGFEIKPNDPTDDYDWAIFDITNLQPDDVFTLPGLVVACNWSGVRGNTGTAASGIDLFTCMNTTSPTFGLMPTLVQGHEYLIMVCNFSHSPFGYDLDFSGGTAVITDNVQPNIVDAWYDETNTTVGVRLNKRLLCSSIAYDASDFTIMPGNIPITFAVGINCHQQIDGDSVLLQLSQPLPPGNYTVTINSGTDANTLLDACNRQIPPGVIANFTVSGLQVSSTQANVSCYGANDGSATINAVNGVAPYSYSWNTTPVQTTSTVSGLSAGTYTCTVTDGVNVVRQIPVTITEPAPLPMASAGNDLLVSGANSCTLTGVPYPGGTGFWQQVSGPGRAVILDPSAASTAVTNMQDGVYTFRWSITDGICSNSDTMMVTITAIPGTSCQFILPNAFSPNNDGKNDLFKPGRSCSSGRYLFTVFNRWGEMIFRASHPSAGWNGHYNGYAQPAGVYAWMIQYTDGTGKQHVYKGTVVLVR